MDLEADRAENPLPCDCQDVCSLPAESLRDRKAMLARELLPQVMRRRRLEHGWALDFADTPAMNKTLEDLVAFERACCSSLSWNLDRPKANVLRLRIEGLSPDHGFFGILGSPEPRRARVTPAHHLAHVTVAGGFGAIVSLLLCCAAPLGVAAVVGATVAAPFAMMDRPVFVVLGALAAGIPTWLWLRRRDRRRHAP